jgi:hypothetical protein
MLDLDPGVHLHEVETTVLGQQKLDRAGILVTGCTGRRDRRLSHLGPQLRIEGDGRRLLDDLLVAPLNRALALSEMDDPSRRVREHLKLDVTGFFKVLLEVERGVPEGSLGLVPGRIVGAPDLIWIPSQAHPAAPAAG